MQTTHEIRLDNKCPIINVANTEVIRCSNPSCKKLLLRIKHTPISDSVLYKLIVECPYCHDKSYEFAVKGEFNYIVKDGLQIIKVEENKDVVIFRTREV